MTVSEFERTSVAGVLQEAATEGGLLRFRLAGGLGFAFPELVVRAFDGKIHEILEPAIDAERCLVWVALAPSGILERWPDVERPPLGRGLPVLTAFAEAERTAARVLDHVEEIGGLEARLRPDHVRMMASPDLPDLAARILRLVDGERTVVEILARSPAAPEMAARVLARTVRDGLLDREPADAEPREVRRPVPLPPPRSVPEPSAPDAGATRPGGHMPEPGLAEQAGLLPSRMEMTGSAVAADIRRWLQGSQVPDSLLSDKAFSSAFGDAPGGAPSVAGRVRAAVPVATRRPEPAVGGSRVAGDDEDEEDDDALFASAGVGPRVPLWLIGLLSLLLGILLALFLFRGGPSEPGPPEPVVATATVTQTSTVVATATVVAPPPPPPPAVKPKRRRRTAAAVTVPRLEGTPLERAAALLEAGNAEAAEAILADLRRSRPGKAEVWRLSAQAAVDLERYELALRHAQRAIGRAPRQFESWVVKGSALQFGGQSARAIKTYRRALGIAPEHPRAEEVRQVLAELEGGLAGAPAP